MNEARRDEEWLRANRPQEAPSGYDHINPSHYKGDRAYEPIDVIEDWGLNYHLGNALKYIARNGRKPGEDPRQGLSKAIWYLERLQDKYTEEIRQAQDADELIASKAVELTFQQDFNDAMDRIDAERQNEREFQEMGDLAVRNGVAFAVPSIAFGSDEDAIPFTATHEDIIAFEEWEDDPDVWDNLSDT